MAHEALGFIENQPKTQKEAYFNLLRSIGSLSKLFSDNGAPYLHYRVLERAFAKAFEAEDISREDSSFDTKKDGIGIGLKTFLHQNGNKIEKIAEFNNAYKILGDFQQKPEDFIREIAKLRNARIEATKRIHNLGYGIYHCVTRKHKKFYISEIPLNTININEIKIDHNSLKKNTLVFNDNLNEYRFSQSKTTLMQRFLVDDSVIDSLSITVLDDPFELIQQFNLDFNLRTEAKPKPQIILPLYSERDNNVPQKSGLNQWNAGGRERNKDEVYIQIPKWIHERFPDFFPNKEVSFTLKLPNGTDISAKQCQDGGSLNDKAVGKALMSNPNKVLGHWILRTVLKLKEGELCTLRLLQELDIDSVQITKFSDSLYSINFMPSGTYKAFQKAFKKNKE